MANDLQIEKRMAVIKDRMMQILRAILQDYQAGLFPNQMALQSRIYSDLQNFYASIGKPTFVPIKAVAAPYSKDHNTMMAAIHQDLLTLYSEVSNMTDDIQSNFDMVEMERQAFTDRINKVQNALNEISTAVQQDSYRLVFRDDFIDTTKFAKDSTDGIAANLSTEERLLTLSVTSNQTFNDYATVTVAGGNGLPGNTHIVRSANNALSFDGIQEMHINLADMLDGNADTWFEYEMFNLTMQGKDQTGGLDFNYKEGVPWITDGTEMKLAIRIDFPVARLINWFSITPFIPSDKGASAAIVEQVVITDGKGTINSMGAEDLFASSKGYLFPRQSAKTILIYLRQPVAYETNVGHIFYKQINTENISTLDASKQSDGIRVHGPTPSIQNLGVTYDTGTQEIIYPVVNYGDTIADEDQKKQNLFTVPTTDSSIQAGLESVQAYRYIIGIRDITAASYQYEEQSDYVSEPFVSATPIQEIELDVNSDIPDQFDPTGDWLQYYISIDQGQNWNRIYPRYVNGAGLKTKYIFNSGTQVDGRVPEIGYIDTLTAVNQVQFKISLSRPVDIKDANFYTPVVYGYELYALTEDGVSQ